MYVAVGSQRVAQGEIDNFDVCVRVIVGDAILGVLNKGVIASVALVPNGAAEARGARAGCARALAAARGAGRERNQIGGQHQMRSHCSFVAAANCSLD